MNMSLIKNYYIFKQLTGFNTRCTGKIIDNRFHRFYSANCADSGVSRKWTALSSGGACRDDRRMP